MNFKKHLLPILYFFCLCSIVLTISLTACTPLNTQTNHQKNHGLVEVCVSSQIAPQKTPFLLQKLSQESPAIDTISYPKFHPIIRHKFHKAVLHQSI